MIKLYGLAHSRASRSLVALEELGLAYQHVPMQPWRDPDHKAAILKLNPSGRVPVLDDDGLILADSMAINLYLGDRYGGPLWPTDVADRALMYRWSFFLQTEIDVAARNIARQSKDETVRARAETERWAAFAILDRALRDRPYLLGDAFTMADLNVAASIAEPQDNGKLDGLDDPADFGLTALSGWVARCTGRPSWKRVSEMP